MFVLSLLCVLCVSLRTTALPPAGFEVEYKATVEVFDINNNPVQGVTVRLRVDAHEAQTGAGIVRSTTGTTNSSGQVTIRCYIDYYDYPVLDYLTAWVDDPDYYQTSAVGNQSTTSKTIYPDTWVVDFVDTDNNSVNDCWEESLAAKFCPIIVMHNGNAMIPSPVEVMLDNVSLCGGLYADGTPNIKFQTGQSGTTIQQAFLTYSSYWNSNWYLDFGGLNVSRLSSYWHMYYNAIKSNYQTPTVYTHCFVDNDRPVIQYWFFYPYNDWGGDHEGDWEHINVKVTSQYPDNASGYEVVYYFHEMRNTLSWSQINSNGNSPFVFVGGKFASVIAEGEEGGGSYWAPGIISNVAELFNEIIFPGRVCAPSEIDLINMTNNNNLWWMTFPGMWGVPEELCNAGLFTEFYDNDGPPSPIHHKCWEDYKASDWEEY